MSFVSLGIMPKPCINGRIHWPIRCMMIQCTDPTTSQASSETTLSVGENRHESARMLPPDLSDLARRRSSCRSYLSQFGRTLTVRVFTQPRSAPKIRKSNICSVAKRYAEVCTQDVSSGALYICVRVCICHNEQLCAYVCARGY